MNARTGVLKDYLEQNKTITNVSGNESDVAKLEELGFDLSRNSRDKTRNNYGYRLVELCKKCELLIANGRLGQDRGIGNLTCKNASVVDYFIMSPRLFTNVSHFKINDFSSLYSDVHCSLECYLSVEITHNVDKVNDPVSINSELDDYCKRPKWRPEFKEEYLNNIDEECIKMVNTKMSILNKADNVLYEDVQISCSEVVKILIDAGIATGSISNSNNVRVKRKRKFDHKPWYNADCENKRREFHRLKNRYKSKSAGVSYEDVNKLSKEYRNTLNRNYKRYYRLLNNKLKVLKSNNAKEYWEILKEKSVNKKHESAKLQMSTLVEHFEKIGNSENVTDPTSWSPRDHEIPHNDKLDAEFTLDELNAVVKKLKNGKAPGCDQVLNEFIKFSYSKMAETICLLFNLVLKTGHIPEEWAIGHILPIYKKKGDPTDPDNYRGITLLSTLGKLFTSALNSRLGVFLEDYGVLIEEQAGFRAGYSTVDHIFALDVIIRLYLHKGKKLYCAFIDYRKAFDSIDRVLLWQKLLSQNIGGKFMNIVYNMYEGAKSKIRHVGKISNDFIKCNVGVRQGENLSPVLFALFLNDLSQHISNSCKGLSDLSKSISDLLSDDTVEVFFKLFLLLYADDTILMAESAEDLQKALNSMYQYCVDWNLEVNPKKTKIVIFSKGKTRNHNMFTYNNIAIDVLDDFTYLGVVFNYNGNFKKEENHAAQQGNKSVFSLMCKSRALNLTLDVQIDLFDKLVSPVLLYGSEVWGPYGCEIVKRVQLKFYKSILKLNKSTPTNMVLGEVGKVPMDVTIKKRVLNYWFKMVSSKNPCKINVVLYKLLVKLDSSDESYKSPWLTYVKNSLNELGLSFLWINQDNINIVNHNWFKSAINLRINDQFQAKWVSTVQNSDSCIIYRIVKQKFGIERYLSILPTNLAIKIAKFRCRSNKLPISVKRYDNDINTQCTLCNSNEICDEIHLVLQCQFFCNERLAFLGKKAFKPVNIIAFRRVMHSNSFHNLIKLSRFMNIIMSVF